MSPSSRLGCGCIEAAGLICALALMLAAGAPVAAAAPAAKPPALITVPAASANPGSQAHVLSQADLVTFFDGMIPYAIQRANIAGATVAVVAGGKLLFAGGYGYSNVKTRTTVVADQTLFRPGSISKLFIWTAVMQLVQAGKVNLDRDINSYLDFRIPPKFGRPITMRDLMTHTPGFEDTISQMMPNSAQQLMPLREYLIKHMPRRIFAPGTITAYSNYGATLAGYIVQRISGEPFDEYVEQHIFQPLGMDHSTFEQPPPPALNAKVSQSYDTESAEKPEGFEYIQVSPAGALSTTALDMARFMIAQLGDGSDGGAPILDPQTLALMHSPQSRMAPGMNGFDLGFYQENRNGLTIIGHGGDTRWFHSDLHLLLNKDVGIFMSFNSAGTRGAGWERARGHISARFSNGLFPVYRTRAARRRASKPGCGAGGGLVYVLPTQRERLEHPQRAHRNTGHRAARRWDRGRRAHPSQRSADRLARGGAVDLPRGRRAIASEIRRTDRAGRVRSGSRTTSRRSAFSRRVHGLKQLSDLKVMLAAFCGVLLLTLAIWLGGLDCPTALRHDARPPAQAAAPAGGLPDRCDSAAQGSRQLDRRHRATARPTARQRVGAQWSHARRLRGFGLRHRGRARDGGRGRPAGLAGTWRRARPLRRGVTRAVRALRPMAHPCVRIGELQPAVLICAPSASVCVPAAADWVSVKATASSILSACLTRRQDTTRTRQTRLRCNGRRRRQ